jgi:hypothetical protein
MSLGASISLYPGSIARVLWTTASLLVFASIAGDLTTYFTGHDHVYGLIPLFCLNAEQNIPTFFSALLLLFASLLLAVITMLEKKRWSVPVLYWATLSFGFFLMAADELLCLHEKTQGLMRTLLGDGALGVFYFAWVIPGLVLVLGVSIFFLKFLLGLPLKTRISFIAAAVLYVGGCIGFELVGGHYAESHGQNNLIFGVMTTVEESLEMAGIIVFIRGLLAHIADNYKEVRFLFHEAQEMACPAAS